MLERNTGRRTAARISGVFFPLNTSGWCTSVKHRTLVFGDGLLSIATAFGSFGAELLLGALAAIVTGGAAFADQGSPASACEFQLGFGCSSCEILYRHLSATAESVVLASELPPAFVRIARFVHFAHFWAAIATGCVFGAFLQFLCGACLGPKPGSVLELMRLVSIWVHLRF